MNEPQKNSEIASRILALAKLQPVADEPSSPKPVDSGSPAVATPSDLPKSVPSRQSGAIVEDFAYDFDGLRVHRKHKDFLPDGADPRDPRDIKHIPFGEDKGCICDRCMVRRGRRRDVTVGVDNPRKPSDAMLSKIISEKFCGRILNLPNRGMELFCRIRQVPEEAVNIWKTEEEDIKVYGEIGKHLADYYLHLPDFKHKELILFGAWYMSEFGMKLTAMIAIMKGQSLRKAA